MKPADLIPIPCHTAASAERQPVSSSIAPGLKAFVVILYIYAIFSSGVYAITDTEFSEIKTLIEQENIQAAHQQLKTLRSSETKTSALTHVLIGRMYLSLGKPSKAYDHFDRATFTSVTADALAYSGLAQASLALGNLPEATRFCDKSLLEDPDLVEAKITKAQILSDLGKTQEAEMAFQRSIGSGDRSLWATRIYAQSLMRLGENSKAKKLLQNALLEKEADAPTLDLLGKLFWTEGALEEAVRLRSRAADQFALVGNQERADQIRISLDAFGITATQKDKSETDKKTDQNKSQGSLPEAPEQPHARNDPDDESNEKESTARPQNKRPIFRARTKPEILRVDHKKPVMSGSGVLIYGGQRVLTNRHVVEHANTIMVRNGLGEVRNVEKAIFSDEADLAILVLGDAYPAAYSLSVENLVEPKAGEAIYVIGYPLSSILGRYNPSITQGIVSKTTGFGEKMGGFQLTARVNPGNSGGPIVNSNGQLVGVAVGRLDKQQVMEEEGFIPADVSLGIPAGVIRDFLETPQKEAINTDTEYEATEIYEYMRAAVVFVVGQE